MSTWEVAKLFPTRVPLVGDVREGLLDILEALGQETLPGQVERQVFLSSFANFASGETAGINPKVDEAITGDWLTREMQRIFPPDTIIVDEAIRTSRPLLANYRFAIPDTYYKSSGGALGWGLPAALGISLARPGQKVVAMQGDGGSLFSIQALWTAAHYQIPVLAIICNNRRYQAVQAALESYNGAAVRSKKFIGSIIDNPALNFVSLADSFGVPGRRVQRSGEVGEALQAGLNHAGPYLLEVVIK